MFSSLLLCVARCHIFVSGWSSAPSRDDGCSPASAASFCFGTWNAGENSNTCRTAVIVRIDAFPTRSGYVVVYRCFEKTGYSTLVSVMYPVKVRLLSERASNTFDSCKMKAVTSEPFLKAKVQPCCRIVFLFFQVRSARASVVPPPYAASPQPPARAVPPPSPAAARAPGEAIDLTDDTAAPGAAHPAVPLPAVPAASVQASSSTLDVLVDLLL